MKMYFGASDIGAVECDLEDVLEELGEIPPTSEFADGKGFVGLENDNHYIINIVRISDSEWSVVVGDNEKTNLKKEEIEAIIKDFFDGKYPEWAENAERVDFLDGIDDILDGEW